LGTEEFDLFIKEATKEITIKAGQKCTAVRRLIVPEDRIDEVEKAIAARLATTKIGDPMVDGVRMGALATANQVARVRASVDELSKSQKIVYGDLDNFEVIGADRNVGAFFSPVLFRNNDPFNKT
ncbi:MAG: aldehyde dehydrogenase family protein, partial [Bacteroidota bacterium]